MGINETRTREAFSVSLFRVERELRVMIYAANDGYYAMLSTNAKRSP
jgi:hypothetical protein